MRLNCKLFEYLATMVYHLFQNYSYMLLISTKKSAWYFSYKILTRFFVPVVKFWFNLLLSKINSIFCKMSISVKNRSQYFATCTKYWVNCLLSENQVDILQLMQKFWNKQHTTGNSVGAHYCSTSNIILYKHAASTKIKLYIKILHNDT